MAKLTGRQRKKLPKSSFAIKSKRAYPIHDKAHARAALARVKQHGTKAQQKAVRSAVTKKFPSLKKSGGRKRK